MPESMRFGYQGHFYNLVEVKGQTKEGKIIIAERQGAKYWFEVAYTIINDKLRPKYILLTQCG